MCGFLAMVGDRHADDFDAALATLIHRGPDAEGRWRGDGVLLGHRRLAVIDLVGGIQPMASADGRFQIVYNGELYNFRELRAELEKLGHAFTTRSDTEVVLQAFVQWGADCLGRFDGMFALAIWDDHQRALFVARDRLGVKPLFYSADTADGQFICASTVAPFWKLGSLDRQVNYAAVRDYLAQQFISPPDTIVKSVSALEPGTWLLWRADAGELTSGRFWDLPAVTDQPVPLEELIEATDAALRESVRRQMVADVDLGVLFSGGIDSSLVAYYLAKASTQPVQTFTVKFEQSARHDEAPIAARVAAKLGTTHREYAAGRITESQFATCLAVMDQPFGDSSFLPVMKLSELARQHVTVVMGGDGGDELFGGYPRYQTDESSYPDAAIYRMARRGVEAGWLPTALYRAVLRGRARVTRHYSRMGDYPVTTRSVSSILSPQAIALCDPSRTMQAWQDSVLRWTGRMDADSLMRADMWYYLSQNCLVKTDRASMTHSLEARVPFLGNAVVDLVLQQPASTKLAHGLKTVLTALARRHLPREVWDRPKRGFTVPESYYLCDAWRDYCQDLVSRCADVAPFLNAGEIARRWRLACAGRRVDWPMYSVIVLLGWLDTHRLQF